MATLKTNLIEPEGATTTLTVGEAGGNTVIGADSLKANTLKTKGGYYKYAVFTSPGANTWTCPTGVTSAEILIVAGGGGGGYEQGGGAGAGGVVHDTAYTVVAGVVYDLTVGAGGAGGTSNATAPSGSNSTWNDNAEGSGVKYTAIGGGGGSSRTSFPGGNGGSGGGGGASVNAGTSTQQSAGTPTGGTVTSYGFAGGGQQSGYSQDGGGGGAGAVGGTNPASPAGPGAPGGAGRLFSNFTDYGVNGYFAGGGGGGGTGAGPSRSGGRGGSGGGGDGGRRIGYSTVSTGQPAINGTGGGGGGTAYEAGGGSGGDGGSGIVLIRYQDINPATLFVSNGSGTVSSVGNGWGGAQRLIQSQTASGASSISFTSGIDSTYDEYVFEFINIHSNTNGSHFHFQANAVGETGYNEQMTTTFFDAYHTENNSLTDLGYRTVSDQGNGTAYQQISKDLGSGSNCSTSGELHIFNPSSTTYVKNWSSRFSCKNSVAAPGTYMVDFHVAGYFNITAAIDEFDFKVTSGNFDGIINLYGIK